MTKPRDSARRSSHLRDEADALQAQQTGAGGTHAPVGGPLVHTEDDLRRAVAAAVEAERQRCLALARDLLQSIEPTHR